MCSLKHAKNYNLCFIQSVLFRVIGFIQMIINGTFHVQYFIFILFALFPFFFRVKYLFYYYAL